jgi:3-hydroxyisobutyrate dehydrogenase-like beta-hydroxyacid dehydrogenase
MKTAFIGLGVMGYPMAGHLKKPATTVTVFNRSPARAAKWAAPNMAAPRADAGGGGSKDQEIVFCCVGRDSDLRQVTLGERRRLCRHEERRAVRGSHHRLGHHRPRIVAKRQGRRALNFSMRRCRAARPGR